MENYPYFRFDGTQAVNGATSEQVKQAFQWTPDMELYFIMNNGQIKHHCIGTEKECQEMIERIMEDDSALLERISAIQARGGFKEVELA